MTVEQAFQLADTQHRAGRLAEAEVLHRQIVAVAPRHPGALHALGAIALATDRHEEALDLIAKAIALSPHNAIYHSNLGETYRRMGRFDEAIASYRHALDLRPELAETHAFLGAALFAARRPEEAVQSCQRALEAQPQLAEAHWNLALSLLQLGRYAEGWKEHEWRWQTLSFPSPRRNFSVPQWGGSPQPGATLLLHAEQGLGDTIQFLRYVPLVRERAQAARVFFECPAELVSLVTASGGCNVEIIARENWDGATLPRFDTHLPLLSLPFALALPEPWWPAAPYLRSDETRRTGWRARLPRGGFRVGVAWAGSPVHGNDRLRSMPFEMLRPLLCTPGIDFFSLQVDRSAPPGTALIDLAPPLGDFADTAALMAELDLVITVDTAVAHLAGALGRPVWTLLPYASDWRWGLGREDTAWYPTMRLFRQRAPGDWPEVIERVATALHAARP